MRVRPFFYAHPRRCGASPGLFAPHLQKEVAGSVKPGETSAARSQAEAGTTPFRFYDNRQKYLAFVNTCNEKSAVARRAAHELSALEPSPPAIRIFDAGMGDA